MFHGKKMAPWNSTKFVFRSDWSVVIVYHTGEKHARATKLKQVEQGTFKIKPTF